MQNIDTLYYRFYQGSDLQRFFVWWWANLLAIFPSRLAACIQYQPEQLILLNKDDAILCYRYDGTDITLLRRLSLSEVTSLTPDEIKQLYLTFKTAETHTILALPKDNVLVHQSTLPVALEENLEQTLMFEMDRLTPVNAKEMYFDYKILSRNKASGKIKIQLYCVLRREVDPILAQLEKLGFSLHCLDIHSRLTGTVLQLSGVNLLPYDKRHRSSYKSLYINLFLTVAVILISLVAITQSVENKQQRIQETKDRVQHERQRALEVAKLKEVVDDVASGANFLLEQKQNMPAVSEVLFRLTQILPRHTYLKQLHIKKGEVELEGLSDTASGLIPLLEQSIWFDQVGLRAPITQDKKANKEKFKLKARVAIEQFRDDANSEKDLPESPLFSDETEATEDAVNDAANDAGIIENQNDEAEVNKQENNLEDDTADNADPIPDEKISKEEFIDPETDTYTEDTYTEDTYTEDTYIEDTVTPNSKIEKLTDDDMRFEAESAEQIPDENRSIEER